MKTSQPEVQAPSAPIVRYRNRAITEQDLAWISLQIEAHPGMGRTKLSQLLCEQWNWRAPTGRLKEYACRDLLLRLEEWGHLNLPPRQRKVGQKKKASSISLANLGVLPPASWGAVNVAGDLDPALLEKLCVRPVVDRRERLIWRALMDRYHYLGEGVMCGEHLLYLATVPSESGEQIVACLGWGAASLRNPKRDEFLGWDATALRSELHLVVNCTYMKIIKLLCIRGIGIKMLRQKLGIDPPSPDDSNASAQKGKARSKDKKGKKGRHKHGRRGSDQFPNADHRFFAHPTLDEPGTTCSGCKQGGLYPHFGQWHRFEGQPFLRVLIVNYEIWRCSLCQESHPAPIAQDIMEDGKERQVFGFSAIALIVISKYFLGTPWARQARLQSWMELPLPASTASDQTHAFSEVISPVHECLKRFGANAWLFCSDDTGIRIIRLKQEIKKQRKTQKETLRTGVHTSVILAECDGDRKIALFKSGILHAGEFLDEILRYRDEGLPRPLHMADGSSCNPATVEPAPTLCACNSHGRRKLDEKQDLYPEHWEVMRLIYRDVYKFDAETKRLGMTKDERLAYHREHSLPLMEKLFAWMQKELDDKNVEPNSQLGGIFEYFLARMKPLMAFTEYPGAPLDNNAVEQLIKLVALLRKNAMSFLTLTGAEDADKIMSVGATAGMAGVNLYDYFLCLQKYAEEVKENPENFLPWTYQETVRRLKEKALRASPQQVRELTASQWKERQERIRLKRAALKKGRPVRPPPHNTLAARPAS